MAFESTAKRFVTFTASLDANDDVLDEYLTTGKMALESTAKRFVAFTASFDANVVVFDAQTAVFDE